MIDVFRIGVHIGMTTNSGSVLGILMRDLMGVNGAVSALSKNLGTMKTLAVGALATFAGVEALRGIWSMVEASKELNKQLENIKMQGASSNRDRDYLGRVGELRQRAFDTSVVVPQITPSENVKILNEASNQFGIDAAESLSVKLAQLEAQLKRAGKGGNLQAGLKGLDQIGGIFSTGPDGKEQFDAVLIGNLLDKMRRGISASGGMLGPQDYLAWAKQAGLSAKQMDSDAIFGFITEALIAMGSSRAGTATGSLYQQMIGGTMTQKVAAELKKHGLIDSYQVGRGGEIIPQSANIKEKALFEKNEFQWINDVVVPKLQAEGMNPRQVLEEVSHLFGRATTQRLVGEMINNKPQFERTAELFKQAMDIEKAMDELNKNDLDTNLRGLEGAWRGLMEAVGEQGVPVAISMIHGLTDVIITLEQAAANHPGTTRLLLELASALAALIATGGALTVISVALGPFTAAIRALGAVNIASAAAGVAGLEGATAKLAAVNFLGAAGGILALVGALGGLIWWLGSNVNEHSKGAPRGGKPYSPPEMVPGPDGHMVPAGPRALPSPWGPLFDPPPSAAQIPMPPNTTGAPDNAADNAGKVWSRTKGWHDPKSDQMPMDRHAADAPATALPGATPANPLHVQLTDGSAQAVGGAAASGTVQRVINFLSRPQSGQIAPDGRMSPSFYGSPP